MHSPKGIDLNMQFGKGLGYEVIPDGMEPDMFGVEVELEGMKLKTEKAAISKWWTNHVDNSLRVVKPGAEHTEYVFRKPYNMADTIAACTALMTHLTTNPGTEVFKSYRTSIHVHVNCLLESVRTVCNFITLCIIFDELLVSQNGEHRIGNNFCLRSKDAEGQVADLVMSVSQYGSLYNLQQQHRYSSINFASLLKFGTVEFRSLECTTDLQRLLDWIGLVNTLKEAARTYDNPKEIIAKFSRRGPLGFMISHLGDHYQKYAAIPGAHHMLQNGMRLAQDFAYCSDWVHSETAIKPKRKPSKYEDIVLHNQQPQGWAQPAMPGQAIPMPNDVPMEILDDDPIEDDFGFDDEPIEDDED